LRDYFA